MRARAAIAALVIAGAVAGIAVYAWPADAKLPKPTVINSAPPRELPVVRTLHDVWDAHDFDLTDLIPRGSRVNRVWYAQAGRHHQRVLVEWTDPHRYVVWGRMHDRTTLWGLTLWSSTGSRWQAVNIPVVVWPGPMIRVAFADVTSDNVPDLLFEQWTGNHGCGPHQVFTTSASGVTTQAFSSDLCETSFSGDHGLLALGMANDLEPEPVCCPEFYEHQRLRWDGHRFVRDSVHIEKSGLYLTG